MDSNYKPTRDDLERAIASDPVLVRYRHSNDTLFEQFEIAYEYLWHCWRRVKPNKRAHSAELAAAAEGIFGFRVTSLALVAAAVLHGIRYKWAVPESLEAHIAIDMNPLPTRLTILHNRYSRTLLRKSSGN